MRQQISSFSIILVFSTTFPFFAQSQKPTSASSSILDEGGEARESCPANVCFHGGTCFTKRLPDGTKEFECECLDGFTGDLCELKCTLPCQGTTTTTQIPCPTPFLSQLNETTGEMECICPPGRAGEHCELEEAQCNGLEAKEKCQNGGQCIQMGTKASFCICPTGFSGSHCEKMDEEMAMPRPSESSNPKGEECSIKGRECLNGGKCIRRGNGDQNYCKCKGQFTGIWCDRPLRLTAGNGNDEENEESTTIESPNGKEKEVASSQIPTICSPNPCKNDGVCFPMENGQPHCHCPFGRSTGKFCQLKCHCPRGQGCVESTVELGRVECFRREESNAHQNKTKITNDDEKEENNNHPFGNNEEEEADDDEAKEFVIDADVRNFNIFESTTANGTDELVLGEGKMQRITMGERNVSSCLECENSVKCLENASKRIKCFCSPDYSGPLCDVKNSLCDFLGNCPKPGHRCRLHRGNPFKEDFAFCDCPLGMTGSKCARPTLLGFTNNSSTLLLQSSNIRGGPKRKSDGGNDYKLALTFRTTLPFVHLATAETLLGHSEFSIWLENGQILLKIGGTNQSQPFGFDGLEMPLNDGEWYELRLWSTKEAGTGFEIHLSEGEYLLARRTLSASRLFSYSIWSTRIGTNFIGCMRDVSLNGEDPVESGDERAFAISPKCDRQKQCVNENQCQNGGRCIDLWDKFACECPRPFLPPKCGQQIREVTLGHGDAPSMVKFGLSQEEQKLVAENTKISFLLRTNQQKNAPLFFIGEPTTNASSDPETMTFISGEMERGTVKVNVRLGSKMVYGLRSGVPVNDNLVHLVEIEREGNELLLNVDQNAEPILRLSRPFEHPLLANELLIGGDGGIKFGLPIDAFTSRNGTNGIGPFFRGTIQDFRINDHFVLFDSLPDEVEGENLSLFGQKQEEQNLLQGTISDDICALDVDQSSPCGEHGQCRNTFNDFECQCQSGWMGPRCEQRDFCGNSSICPNGSKCENVGGGFVCLTAATLTPNSALRFTMNPGNVIKSSTKHTNLTLEFRTRSLDGNLLKLHSPMESLSVQLRQGLLFLTAASIPFANSTPSFASFPSNLSSLSDGQWHKLLIRQQTAPNGLQILVDIKEKEEEFFATNFSLKRFALDGQARISIGRLADQQGFKGCIRNVHLGIFPPLSFLMAQQDAPPQMSDSLNSLPHFALQKRENIRTNMGCQSEDVCAKNPCLNGARCEDQFNQMHCECAQGFEGEFCELQKDECELMNGHKECGQNGKCVDELNGFRCQCAPAYSGPKCQQEKELCRADSCKNGGKCQTVNGTLHCECPSKFIGQWCQSEAGVKCSEQPCQNGGQCFQTTHGEIACTCRPGIIGPLCELRLDPCREMPCSNGGKCIPPPDNSTTPVDFRCDCSREFAGALCEKLADICDRMGNASCNGHGKCENVWGGHRCICDEGWRGRDCSIRMDICQEEMPCQNEGICQTDQNNPNHFRCHCPPFYLGERCEIPGVCSENPCENGGECVQTSATEHVCRCARGFQGPACQHQIDFCATEPCLNGGNCQPLVGDFKCQCIPGFGGKRCEQDINECELPRSDGDGPVCLHGGRCMDKVNGFECNCQGTGYKGSRCELDIDECTEAALNCQNGICLNLPGGYRCECKSGYIGQRCHVIDPCVSNPLTNHSSHNCAHGKCVRSRVVMGAAGREFATHDCECFARYTGELCMRLIEAQHAMTLYNFIGLGIVVLICCILLGILLYFFVGCARRKRANQGTYSPSSQEMTGQARFVGTNSSSHRPAIIHPKHDNNHHHASIGDHHKPRRKQ